MANIYQIHLESGLSLHSLRKLDKRGYLRVTKAETEAGTKLALALRRRKKLNAGQLVMLYKDQSFAERAGRHEAAALNQLDAMGDIAAEAAPIEIAAHLLSCATKDKESLDLVAAWLRQHMDTSPAYVSGVPYVHVAVRLMASLPDNILANNIKN